MINRIAPLVQAGQRYPGGLSAATVRMLGLAAVLLLCAAGCQRDPELASRQPSPSPENSQADPVVPSKPSTQVPEPLAAHASAGRAAIPSDAPPPPTEVAAHVPAWLPLADATPGEWVDYETLNGQTLRYEVLKVSSLVVTSRVTIREAGRTWGEPAMRDDDPAVDLLAREAQRRQAARRVEAATVQAAGRSWEAILYEDRWTDEDIQYIRRTWVNSQVPYAGTLRMELRGDDQLEARLVLRDYGPR